MTMFHKAYREGRAGPVKARAAGDLSVKQEYHVHLCLKSSLLETLCEGTTQALEAASLACVFPPLSGFEA